MGKKENMYVERLIVQLENPYPDDDLILSYADFLKVRDCLGFYQFNPVVFARLVALVNQEWKTEKKINRLSLLLRIKIYFYLTIQNTSKGAYIRETKPNFYVSNETRNHLFEIFRKTFEEQKYISPKQLEYARKICNNILINLELNPSAIEWFCVHYAESGMILNRVLRYPVQSDIISKWAQNNYQNNHVRGRRAELCSWIIDQNPEFEIDMQTLIDDFEYSHQLDKEITQAYVDEMDAIEIIKKDLGDVLPKVPEHVYLPSEKLKYTLSVPQLKLSPKSHQYSIDLSGKYPEYLPDFESTRKSFYRDLAKHHQEIMIMAITYSRLDNSIKFPLLKKYYSGDQFGLYLVIGKRIKSVELLQWLLGNE